MIGCLPDSMNLAMSINMKIKFRNKAKRQRESNVIREIFKIN